MIDACQNCQWGPNGSKQCENVTLPLLMRGEGCAYWDLYRRFGEPKPAMQNRGKCDEQELRHI